MEQQVARVNVTDEQWKVFRRACLDDGVPVSDALGRLVETELRKRGPRRTEASPTRRARARIEEPRFVRMRLRIDCHSTCGLPERGSHRPGRAGPAVWDAPGSWICPRIRGQARTEPGDSQWADLDEARRENRQADRS